MIKHFSKLLLLLVILFSACDSPVPKTDKLKSPNTFGITDMSAQERNKLIDGAQRNDKLIIGSWELIAADSNKIAYSKEEFANIQLRRMDFSKDLNLKLYSLPKTIVFGTYEWMAEYREVVLTTKYGTDRMLVKRLDKTSLITKMGDVRMMFKRRKK